jgi:mxaJ protein
LATLDDPRLRDVKIGVQVVGDDGVNTPPVHALSSRGIVQNVRGYTLYGDYREANPPARIIDAVVSGDIDVAIVWGPLAGYFAKRQSVPLTVTPVSPEVDRTGLPFVFEIAMGCRKGDRPLRDEVDRILARRGPEIDRILDEYGVPRLALSQRPAQFKDDDDDRGKKDDHDPCCGDGPPK